MDKISAVYKVTNNVTGDFYIGSSVDVKKRWKDHKVPSTRKNRPNMLLYKAMQACKGYLSLQAIAQSTNVE